MEIKKGDIVLRKSHGKDIYFRVESIDTRAEIAKLRGIDIRLCADSPLSDLVKPGIAELANYRAKSLRVRVEMITRAHRQHRHLRGENKKKSNTDYVNIPGTVLHLDGDQEYMEICRKAYAELEITNRCMYVPEKEQPQRVEELLREFNPDILVLTGHDGMAKEGRARDGIENYHNTQHFIGAVTRARAYQPSKDDLVIFAGACQSWYQGIIKAGANFASSPERVLIHCLDPVLIVEKVAYTPVGRTVNILDALQQSLTGLKGVGGIETRGQFRLGLPNLRK
jgi:spore coat assembly protein